MPLTIASIGYPFAPVGPRAVGGAEQILNSLDQELVRSGHTSLVIANALSQPAGALFPIPVLSDSASLACPDLSRERSAAYLATRRTIEAVLSSHPVDLVHMHGIDFYEYLPATAIPILVTLHLPISWYPPDLWGRLKGRVQFQCVSEHQRSSCPPDLANVPVIANGVAPVPLPGRPKREYAIALGRVCPEKNLHAALEAGTLARTPVLLGGQVFPYPEHQNYFRSRLQPLLQNGSVAHQFLGPLTLERKQTLLSQAKCLLHPTLAPETSSLVAMEAMAAGTPVIAYRSGALPDIVQHGVTGFLVDNVQQMAEGIRSVDSLSSQACREAAERHCSKSQMLQNYFRFYETLIDRHRMEKYCA